jgi:hypothetical protein
MRVSAAFYVGYSDYHAKLKITYKSILYLILTAIRLAQMHYF